MRTWAAIQRHHDGWDVSQEIAVIDSRCPGLKRGASFLDTAAGPFGRLETVSGHALLRRAANHQR
eukprot:2376807-Amphidinium_carterae.1